MAKNQTLNQNGKRFGIVEKNRIFDAGREISNIESKISAISKQSLFSFITISGGAIEGGNFVYDFSSQRTNIIPKCKYKKQIENYKIELENLFKDYTLLKESFPDLAYFKKENSSRFLLEQNYRISKKILEQALLE